MSTRMGMGERIQIGPQQLLGLAALLGIGLLAWWISTKTEWQDVKEPGGLSGEALTNPHYAVQKFVEALGGTVENRKTWGSGPKQDAVLVLSYWHWSLIEQRRQQVENWVAAGGRLLIDHTLIGGEEELEHWTGLKLKYAFDDEAEWDDEVDSDADEESTTDESDDEWEEQELADEDEQAHGVCGKLKASHELKPTDLQGEFYTCQLADGSWITSKRPVTWSLTDSEGMQATRIDIGKGSVTLLNATPFGNEDLLEGDHDLLFVALTQLRHGDHVVFLSEEEHPGILALMWQYGKPAVLLVALLIAAMLWRGFARFGPPSAPLPAARRSLAEQIRGTGLFTLQFGGSQTLHAAVLRALEETAERRLLTFIHLNSEERVKAIARATQLEPEKLAQAMNFRGTRTKHELQNAVTLLETARRRLHDNA